MERGCATQVLDRTVAILKAIAASGAQGILPKDIVTAVGLSRATVYRLLDSMRRHGFVTLGDDGHRYQIGTFFLTLGSKASTRTTLADIARPSLLRLSSTFGDGFFLFVHDGYENVCVELREGNYPVSSYARGVGGRVPLGVGQASLCVLAFLPEGERDEILTHNHEILVDIYGINLDGLIHEIVATRRRGYTFGIGSLRMDEFTGIGFPVFNNRRRVVGALSCSVLRGRFRAEKRAQMVMAMQAEVQIIEGQVNPLDPYLTASPPG